MNIFGWIQLALFCGVLLALTKPIGLYLVRVLDVQGKTFLDPALKPVELFLYRFCRIDPAYEQNWKQYSLSLGVFSLIGIVFTYALLRLQAFLPLNPQHFPGLPPDLAFNTAISFATNTNWQNYGGESTMSYASQMVALTFHNFVSSAAGIAIAAALVRGISRRETQALGNFWADLIRTTLYLLLPSSLIFAVVLISQGVVQNLNPYTVSDCLEQAVSGVSPKQTIVQGPLASQEAIKMLGTNGGGYTNANSSHPFENPTPLSNFLEMLAIFLIPSGLTWYLGRIVGNQRHGWAVWTAMMMLFLCAVVFCWWAESHGNPRLAALRIDIASGNMEGKEVRFGIFNSALFATVTTDASCGAVNAMHDSFTPLGGLVPLVNILLGEVVFGGVGAGLYGMLIFVLLSVFLAGLMVGRTPEYLGKKIEAYDIKLCVLVLLALIFPILGFSAWASVATWGLAGRNNLGPHGLSEIFYAFASGAGNNGSAFAGLNGNTPWYNTTLAVAMLSGRFLMIVPILALAGNLARKKLIPASSGSFPVSGGTFTVLLVSTVLIVGALTFFPALALGPIVEHFIMTASTAAF
ncbi:MAG TPA: potassium-transporting ATPase subunit KdpA [Candidatus Hydrogenedentes bacterium]|nr:potassium-transporting ATPase subunit KdpA [Candidatus Hydrogenedentota bacterium]